MSIESIQPIAGLLSIENTMQLTAADSDFRFSSLMKNEVVDANAKLLNANLEVQKLALGEADNLHQVMGAIEKANTAFQLSLQVRNKLLEGYQEIARMQI